METKKLASEDVISLVSFRPVTEREQLAVDNHIARRAAQTAPRMKVLAGKGSAPHMETDHPDPTIDTVLLMEGLGTADNDFFNGLVGQLATAGSLGGEIDEGGLNFTLSVVKGVNPKDQVETMLAAQMAAGHMAVMTHAQRFARVENIAQQDSTGRVFNQLMRTFAVQVEALKRYRTGGEQKVTVHHVSVREGGAGDRRQRDAGGTRQRETEAREFCARLCDDRQPTMPSAGEQDRVLVESGHRKKDGGRPSS